MQESKILMTESFMNKLDAMSEEELETRWLGIQSLLIDHKPKNKPGWMAEHFANPTTLTVGNLELLRLENQRKKALKEAEKKRQKQLEERQERLLGRQKLYTWHHCTTKRQLVEKYCPNCDSFYQQWIRENYLNNNRNLDKLSDREVLIMFWMVIPPFELAPVRPINYIPLEKAS